MYKKLIKKILVKVDKILFKENLRNLYKNAHERKLASYKSDLFNYK